MEAKKSASNLHYYGGKNVNGSLDELFDCSPRSFSGEGWREGVLVGNLNMGAESSDWYIHKVA